MTKINIQIPEKVNTILQKLMQAGFQAYAVGGCIRDTLMGQQPSDWDICTSALPEETLQVLRKPNLVENGKKHGTVTIRLEGENFEITTFRKDGESLDHRHPQEVTYVREVYEDLSRRDFTINALAYNDKEGLIDISGGVQDLRQGIIRCVGDPDKRFDEDGLRMMRALRFASQLGFRIENETAASVRRNRQLLTSVSAERITAEFNKLLIGNYAEQILLDYPDVLTVFLPEIRPMIGFPQNNPHHCYDVWTHTVKVVSFIERDKILRLAALLHDIGKPKCFTEDAGGIGHFKGHPAVSERMAAEILHRMKYDNRTIETVKTLIRLHDMRPPAEPKYVRRLLREAGKEMFLPLLSLKRADARAQSNYLSEEKMAYIDRLEALYQEELQQDTAFTLKMLRLNGRDLIAMGITDGKTIGRILNELLERVIDGSQENDPQKLKQTVLTEFFQGSDQ